MTRRPAVTLMEVLIAMFIMAIGMMALLVLFPVGAVSMAQALKDDRCAYASIMAENVAIATNVRYNDVAVNLAFQGVPPLPYANTLASGLLYVDPYGALLGNLGGPLGIPRVIPSFIANGGLLAPQLTDRWFSLPDDIGFNLSGKADTSSTGGFVDRGRKYSYAFLLRRQPSAALNPLQLTMYTVQLYAVVYSGRPIPPILETTFPAAGVIGTNSITVNAQGTSMKRGGWILDPVNGYFYRVTNLAENNFTVPPSTTVEIQQNLAVTPTPLQFITIMDYVAEVFDKGTGWQQ